MRLLSTRLTDERFAGGTAELEFSQLTALWGPNDAGKTTLLFRVHDVLAWLTGRRPTSYGTQSRSAVSSSNSERARPTASRSRRLATSTSDPRARCASAL